MSSDALGVSFKLSPDLNSRGKRIREVEAFGSHILVVLGQVASELAKCGMGTQEVMSFRDAVQVQGARAYSSVPPSSGAITKLFVSDSQRHCLIATSKLEYYYLAGQGKQASLLPKLKGADEITAVAWFDVPFASSTEASPCHAFLGTVKGQILLLTNVHDPKSMQLKIVTNYSQSPAQEPVRDMKCLHQICQTEQGTSLVTYMLYVCTEKRLWHISPRDPIILNSGFPKAFDIYFLGFFENNPARYSKELPYLSAALSELHFVRALAGATGSNSSIVAESDRSPLGRSSTTGGDTTEVLYQRDVLVWLTNAGMILLAETGKKIEVVEAGAKLVYGRQPLQTHTLIEYPKAASMTGVSRSVEDSPSHQDGGEDDNNLPTVSMVPLKFHFVLLFRKSRKLVLMSRINFEVLHEERLLRSQYGDLLTLVNKKQLDGSLNQLGAPSTDAVNESETFDPNTINNDILLVCDSFAYEVCIENESRGAWRLFLKVKDFGNALKFARSQHKFEVILTHAEMLLKSGNYKKAAWYFAQLPSETRSFETICLQFLDFDHSHKHEKADDDDMRKEQITLALLEYLKLKVQNLQKDETEHKIQLVMLCTWSIELCLNIYVYGNSNEFFERKSVTSSGARRPAIENNIRLPPSAKDTSAVAETASKKTTATTSLLKQLKTLLYFFLNQAVTLDCAGTIYQLLLSYERTEEFLYFAAKLQDYATVVRHHVGKSEMKELMKVLESMPPNNTMTTATPGGPPPEANYFSRNQLLYEYAPLLFQAEPRLFVTMLMRPHFADVSPLCLGLQSIIATFSRGSGATVTTGSNAAGVSSNIVHRSEAIRYLEFVVRTRMQSVAAVQESNENNDDGNSGVVGRSQGGIAVVGGGGANSKDEKSNVDIGSCLKLLCVFHATSTDEDAFMKFLRDNEQNPHLDLLFALRVCVECNKHRSVVLIHGILGNYHEAVRVALSRNDVALAKHNAAKAKDKETRAKLYLMLAVHESNRMAAQSGGGGGDAKTLQDKKQIFENLITESQNLLSVRDILPYISDDMLLENFRADLEQYLSSCEQSIAALRSEMQEHRRGAALLKQDLVKLQNRSIELKLDAICEFCGTSILKHKFVVFECCHAFHVECANRLGVCSDEDCPICGYQMIDAITRPFVESSVDLKEIETWAI